MNIRTTILITLLAPITSQAFVRAPVMPVIGTDAHDCGQRSNSLGSQVDDLQGLVHRVALHGGESGREVSSDPETIEARIAEASGYGLACGKDSATLNIVEHNGRFVLIGSAHAFYKNGELSCKESVGEFFPNDHYHSNSNIDHKKSFKFKLPPLNHDSARGRLTEIDANSRLKDFVILEIEDPKALMEINGRKRMSKKMSLSSSDSFIKLSETKDIFMSSGRENFHNFQKVSIENGCSVYKANRNLKVMRHTCDTGPGSSGASLDTFSNRQLTSIGIHYGSRHKNGTIAENEENSNRGNYFIPSEYIVETLDHLFPETESSSSSISL